MQIAHLANWCTWLAYTLCKGLIWNYKKWTQPWLSFGILQALRWSWECIRYYWWYTLMKNKLYLGLKKNGQHFADNIFKWIFLLKKILSVFLTVCLVFLAVPVTPFHYVPIMVSSRNFQEWLPMIEVMYMQKFKVRGQMSRLQRSKPKLAVSGP